MSEKYSTDDLILWITVSCDINAIKTECDVTDECPECERQRDAIIARLRAFDELRKASKKIIIWFDSRSDGFRERCADEPWSTLRGLLLDFQRREI